MVYKYDKERWGLKKLIICWIVFSLNVHGATEKFLTWNQAIELFKKNNRDYQAAEFTYQATEALELGAQSGYFPSLSGAINYNRSQLMGIDDSSNPYSVSISLSQNLFSGLKDYYKSNQAKASSRLAYARLLTSRAQLSYNFIAAYQSLMTAQENLKLSENIVQRRQENLNLVELRFESGRENKGSVMLSTSYLAQAKYENLQAQHAVAGAQMALAHFMGVSTSEMIKLSDLVPIRNPTNISNFEDLVNQTPNHLESRASLDLNIAAFGVARSSFLPSISLIGALGRNGSVFFPQNDRWSVGVSLNIPLFDGGRDYSSFKSSGLTRDSAAVHTISVDQQQVEFLQKAHQKYIEAVEKLKVDEGFQSAATVRSKIARTQYNNGLISFTEWDNIETDLISRQKAYIQSRQSRVLSEAAWKQACGEGLFQ